VKVEGERKGKEREREREREGKRREKRIENIKRCYSELSYIKVYCSQIDELYFKASVGGVKLFIIVKYSMSHMRVCWRCTKLHISFIGGL
jgi:hypothetical protein